MPVGGLVAGRRYAQSLDHLSELGVIRDGGWDVASVEQLSNRLVAVLTVGEVETNPWLNESRVGPRESSRGFIDVHVASLARCVDGLDDLPVLLLLHLTGVSLLDVFERFSEGRGRLLLVARLRFLEPEKVFLDPRGAT